MQNFLMSMTLKDPLSIGNSFIVFIIDPCIDFVFKYVQWYGTVGEEAVVEAADIEVFTEFLLGDISQLSDF